MVPRSTQLPQRSGRRVPESPRQALNRSGPPAATERDTGGRHGVRHRRLHHGFLRGSDPAHRAEHHHRRSAIDGRTTRHPGYAVSQQKRKLVEEIFGWLKTVPCCGRHDIGGMRRVGWMFTFAAAVYNLVRIRNLSGADART